MPPYLSTFNSPLPLVLHHLDDFAYVHGVEIVVAVILLEHLFFYKTVGVKGLGIEFPANQHEAGLLNPGCSVHVLHVQLSGPELVLVPSGV